MKFDGIILELGEFGRYQKRSFFLVSLVGIACALNALSHVFLTGESDHWCVVPELQNEDCARWPELSPDECNAAKKDASIPPQTKSTNSYEYDNCLRYNLTGVPPFYPGIDTSDYTNDTLKCDYGWVYDTSQYESTITNQFELVCSKSSLSNLMASIYFAGVLVGSLVFGMLSDYIGRYYTYFLAVGLFFCSNLAVAFSPNVIAFGVFRFMVGMGNLGSFIVAFVLGTELVGPSYRTVTGIGIEFFWSFGYMLLALLAFLIRDWFILQIVLTIPLVFLFFLIPILKESPRWLMAKGRFDEAEVILQDIAKVNKTKIPEPLFEESEKQEIIEANKARQASVIDLFRTPTLRWRTLNIMFNWFVNSLVYYGLSLSTSSLGGNDYVSFFLSGLVEVPAYLWCTFGIEWFGRKPNLCGLFLLGGVACISTIFFDPGTAQTTIAMLGKFCITATFAIVYVYSAEVFPTVVRSAGIGIASMSSRIGGIIAPLILIFGDYWPPLPVIIFGSFSVVAGLLVLFLPETKGRTLPQTIEEGEMFGKTPTKSKKAASDIEVAVVSGNINPAFESEKNS
ncbi:organic cation transporter protein-like [Amphiura filiformis]|uniref:organic cation transporter protein-like n=1 Tax=Amphiura filiformis TaxID=82378 RepID=UPI003B21E85B